MARHFHDRLILAVRMTLFLASILFLAGAISTSPKAEGVVTQWAVKQWVIKGAANTPYPWSSTTYEQGWHWNDYWGSVRLGAKDFSRYSSSSPYNRAILWAVTTTSSGYGWHYVLENGGSCRVIAVAEWSDGSSWTRVDTVLNIDYLHLSSKNYGFWTDYMQSNGSGIWQEVGTIANSGSSCQPGSAHVHVAARLADHSGPGTDYIYRTNLDGETCWADAVEGQTADSYCNQYDYSRKNDPPPTCDEVFGSFPRSGSISDYLSCNWQRKGHIQGEDVFEMWF